MTKVLIFLFIPFFIFGCKQTEEKSISEENSTSVNKPLISSDSTSLKRVYNQDEIIYIDNLAYSKKDSTLINGEIKVLHENGEIKELRTIKDGDIDGLRKFWFDNGQLHQEGVFKNGKIHGTRTVWYETGQLNIQGKYNNGQLDGAVKHWWKNGNLKTEVTYKNGRIDGVLKLYHENGKLREERTYKDGKKIK